MNYWSREDTKDWIKQVEYRVEDFDFYLKKTLEWCERNGIYSEKQIFILNFITCVWVSHMRNEEISNRELLEILGVDDFESYEDKVFDLGERFTSLDHEEILEILIKEN